MDLTNPDMARAWLDGQPREIASIIAIRGALRAIPCLSRIGSVADVPDRREIQLLSLLTFRAVSNSWAMFALPDHHERLSASAISATAMLKGFEPFKLVASRSAYEAINSVIESSLSRVRFYAASAIRSANTAIGVASSTFENTHLVNAYSADVEFLTSGATTVEMASSPLWSARSRLSQRRMPNFLNDRWDRWLEEVSRLNQHWEVWAQWYEERLAGAEFNVAEEISRVSISEEFWGQGALAVNTHIKLLTNELRARADNDSRTDDDSLPPVEVIPPQTPAAISFTSATSGPLDVLPDAVSGAFDPEQNELYSQLRSQLKAIIEQIPSQELGLVSTPVEEMLKQPELWKNVKFKKVLWLSGNSLRNVLSQHDAVAKQAEPHYAKLPPVVAEAVRRPIETWNIVVLGDSVLCELDAKRIGPTEAVMAKDQLAAASPIVAAAAKNRNITTLRAGGEINASMTAAATTSENLHARQAQEFARGTSQNLIVQVLRGAYKVAHDLRDPQTEEARQFVKEYKSGIYKKLGEWTVTGSVTASMAGMAAIYFYGVPFFEFVVAQGPWIKAYLGIAFQNPELTQIIDRLTILRAKILGPKNADHNA